MNSIDWVIRSTEQAEKLSGVIAQWKLPLRVRISEPKHPKTLQQIRYAHSLCNALAVHHQITLDAAKRDAKAAYGKIEVSTSVIDGERSARLISFADYTREELTAFITKLEEHMLQNNIEFIESDA